MEEARSKEMVAVRLDQLVNIPQDTITNIIKISDDDVRWLRIGHEGFMDGQAVFAERLYGTVCRISPYWIKWTAGEPPEKMPFVSMEDQPQGFEIRTDIKICLHTGEFVGLSLASSSSHNFSRFVRRLTSQGLNIKDVVTEFTTRSVMNAKGQRFPICEFSYVPRKPKPEDQGKQPADVEIVETTDDEEVPF